MRSSFLCSSSLRRARSVGSTSNIDSPRRDKPGRPMFDVDPADVARRKELEHKKLERMIAYAETGECLRATILRYFGDPAVRDPCGACGNCGRRQ